MAILQRPLFPGTRPEETACCPASRLVDLHRESIWISYCSTAMEDCEPYRLCHFGSHHRLASPVAPWERLKIGGGTPPDPDPARLADHLPRRQRTGGVSGAVRRAALLGRGDGALGGPSSSHPLSFAGASADTEVAARTPGHRRQRRVPTAIDRRDDLGSPDRFDVYYGMADKRIGVARLDVPEHLPPAGLPNPPLAKV